MVIISCSKPSRIPIQLESGIVAMVQRPSYVTTDTVLVSYTCMPEGCVYNLVGNYNGTLPEPQELGKIRRVFLKGVRLQQKLTR